MSAHGSFTGIRIGIATIKAIAESLKIPVIDVSSLEALAYNIEDTAGCNTICSLIDAKNNQVYCGIFDKNCNLLENYLADDIYNIIRVLKKYNNVQFVGDGAIIHKKLLRINNFTYDNVIHAKKIAKCAYNKYIENYINTPDSIIPMYLRPSQAERVKQQTDNIKISAMEISDLELIKDTLKTDFDDFWSVSILENELHNPNSKYIVAKINSKIVGFGGIWKSVDDVHITNIVTAKKFRNKKIGSILLSKLIEMANDEKGINAITLEVNSNNIIAQNLYKKFGFDVVGLRKKYYNNKYDAIIMTKELSK